MATLTPIGNVNIRVLVNDQLDNIAPSWNDQVAAPGLFSHVPLRKLDEEEKLGRAGAEHELHLPNSCCGAHGLSLMITVGKEDSKHTILFDAGPEGGLEKAIGLINSHKPESKGPVAVDLHPNRPEFRGMMTPRGPVTLEADPTIAQLETAGAKIDLNTDAHAILGQMFYVSGEIPRTTSYETGIANGIRLDTKEVGWQEDPLIMDERFVMCHLEGKGLVVFTGCSHAGVVNVMRHAVELGGGIPLFAIVGGFHLTDANIQKLESTVADFKLIQPTVIMPGHCTGWRFQVESEKTLPGRVVPLYCGQKYGLTS
ncbi:uncharacterized protein HMPREF1541_05290 [Cyphellophora europaea CBS 101466]|uniref:Metallo-beta-lactamase domain-containing protein n=1 Tax=Cyphellophora europaea (strain CBS 101466) TaxID=1220924 RepID=W2RTJ9_CYPE1|nr:uncharacterized protein HMPREF1541_05290 [Cyphellophora europaea CBS 101466]ETN39068.1 hypothetical protein HMPREF1541_05290 [Cyphellophora europaea CBS 101466]